MRLGTELGKAAMSDQPRVSFLLLVFNHERFLAQAVASVFAQEHRPLEIVLSDDCSSDGSYAMLKELARNYSGPHAVVVRQNSRNLGLGEHVNRAVEVATGELVVIGAGDDVSCPQRVTECVKAWTLSGGRATSIHSDYVVIDGAGRIVRGRGPVGETALAASDVTRQKADPIAITERRERNVIGCTHAFARRLFNVFGDLPPGTVHEDDVLAFRSAIAGEIWYIDKALVEYRLHDSNLYARAWKHASSGFEMREEDRRLKRDLDARIAMYDAHLSDLKIAEGAGFVPPDTAADWRSRLCQLREISRLKRQALEHPWSARAKTLLKLWSHGVRGRELRKYAARLLPWPLYRALRQARNWVR